MNLLNKDDLYEVLLNPTRENFRYLLQNNLGEEDYLDFKSDWPDKEKMAKHILAMANSGGGCIVFGVFQNDDGTFKISGLNNLKDTADLKNEVKWYVPPSLKYCVKDFVYENSEYDALIDKKFQILIVEDNPTELPFICCRNGEKIKDGDIYIRNGTESEKANNYEISKIIDRKMNVSKVPRKNNMTLQKHLEQLKVLYDELTYTTNSSNIFKGLTDITNIFSLKTVHKKECYPKEDYDAFVVRMLDKKKQRVEEELDI